MALHVGTSDSDVNNHFAFVTVCALVRSVCVDSATTTWSWLHHELGRHNPKLSGGVFCEDFTKVKPTSPTSASSLRS